MNLAKEKPQERRQAILQTTGGRRKKHRSFNEDEIRSAKLVGRAVVEWSPQDVALWLRSLELQETTAQLFHEVLSHIQVPAPNSVLLF